MVRDQQTQGIALVCDQDGRLLEVLYDGLGVTADVQYGRPFTQLVDVSGLGKALNFLSELGSQRVAFDWELHLLAADQVVTLYFTGVQTGDQLFIVAVNNRSGVPQLCDDLMRMNHEQANALRWAIKERGEIERSRDARATEHYDELSRLNNELVNLQRELTKRNIELERLNRLKNQFVGTAAHDLRSPLSIIWSYSDFLLRDLSDLLSEQHLEFLSIIQSSSEFMLNMVDELLDLTAIESGNLNLALQPTDLAALVDHNVKLNSVLAEQKQMQLTFRNEADLAPLVLDPDKIEQVLNNLVSNAIKFSYPGGPVEVRLYEQGGEAVISVRDEGQGIPQDELEQLFQWFGKTSVRGTQGESSSGLGLAIARRIVAGHQGRIWVDSEEGHGSTFYLALPLQTTAD
ncbi:MAG: HAMP domain-containing sensor histidine kinase [Anaerolineae bacterium]|jgi:signal transduction histidine kinase